MEEKKKEFPLNCIHQKQQIIEGIYQIVKKYTWQR